MVFTITKVVLKVTEVVFNITKMVGIKYKLAIYALKISIKQALLSYFAKHTKYSNRRINYIRDIVFVIVRLIERWE